MRDMRRITFIIIWFSSLAIYVPNGQKYAPKFGIGPIAMPQAWHARVEYS
jgi:hypothetical protein